MLFKREKLYSIDEFNKKLDKLFWGKNKHNLLMEYDDIKKLDKKFKDFVNGDIKTYFEIFKIYVNDIEDKIGILMVKTNDKKFINVRISYYENGENKELSYKIHNFKKKRFVLKNKKLFFKTMVIIISLLILVAIDLYAKFRK